MTSFLPTRPPRILLVDDDPSFGSILTRLAAAGNIHLEHRASPRGLDVSKVRESYDVIITDYDLENVTGIQLIHSLEACDQSLPTVLISSHQEIRREMPRSVIYSLCKSEGPQRILVAALWALDAMK
jgi:DNA-binding NtrC family response regulator